MFDDCMSVDCSRLLVDTTAHDSLSVDQKERIGTSYVHRKKQVTKHHVAGGRAKSTFTVVAEKRRGRVVHSKFFDQTADDGTTFVLCISTRQYLNADDELVTVKDFDVTCKNLGSHFVALREIEAIYDVGSSIHVCLHCLTSLYIKKIARDKNAWEKDIMYVQCTRCDSTSKGL